MNSLSSSCHSITADKSPESRITYTLKLKIGQVIGVKVKSLVAMETISMC